MRRVEQKRSHKNLNISHLLFFYQDDYIFDSIIERIYIYFSDPIILSAKKKKEDK